MNKKFYTLLFSKFSKQPSNLINSNLSNADKIPIAQASKHRHLQLVLIHVFLRLS